MKKLKNWIIIDIYKNKALYGIEGYTIRFSEEYIAKEVAEQLYENDSEYLITNIVTCLGL